jgi:hypothetical protein
MGFVGNWGPVATVAAHSEGVSPSEFSQLVAQYVARSRSRWLFSLIAASLAHRLKFDIGVPQQRSE